MVKMGSALLSFLGILAIIVAFSGCVGKKEIEVPALFSASIDSGAELQVYSVKSSNFFNYVDSKGKMFSKLASEGTTVYVFNVSFRNPTNKPINFPSSGLGIIDSDGNRYTANSPVSSDDLKFVEGTLRPKERASGKVFVVFPNDSEAVSFFYDSFSTPKEFRLNLSDITRNASEFSISPVFSHAFLPDGTLQANFTFNVSSPLPIRGDWKMYTYVFDSWDQPIDFNMLRIVDLPPNDFVSASSEFSLDAGKKYQISFFVKDYSSNMSFSDGIKYEVGG